MKFIKRLGLRIAEEWRSIVAGSAIFFIFAFMYVYRLASLTTGLDKSEFALAHSVSHNLIVPMDLLRDAIWLPHTLWLYFLQFIPYKHTGLIYGLRGFSVLIALVAIASVYILLRHWYSYRVALTGAVLLGASSWMLHIGRYASHDVLYLLPLILFASWSQLQTGRWRATSFFITFITGLLCLYVPGLIWIMAAAAIWQRKMIVAQLRSASPIIAISTLVIGCLLITPLLVTVAWPSHGTSLGMIRELLGLPQHMPQLAEIGRSFINLPIHLFIRGSGDPVLYTGNAPLVSFFGSIMLVLGAYDMVRNSFRLDRTKILYSFIVIGTILISINNRFSLTILIPAGYILLANGIRFMLQDWLRVFPKNPVARSIGIWVVVTAVGLTVAYNLMSYFVAWPHTPAAKSSFVTRL